MDKQLLLTKIIAQLVRELEICLRAAHAAHAESTHEQSKAENKYDTRALEASYLAQGQSRQAAELEAAIAAFNGLEPRAFAAGAPIDVGALVELGNSGITSFYFIGSKAGGLEIEHENQEVIVITPQSPLGQQLQGKTQGDHLDISQGGGKKIRFQVAAVY